MNRRTFLKGSLIGVTMLPGCLESGAVVPSLRQDTSPGSYRITAYEMQKDGSTRSPLRFDSEVIDATITTDAPGGVRFAVTNTSERPLTLVSNPAGVAPFGHIGGIVSEKVNKDSSVDDELFFYHEAYDAAPGEHIAVDPEATEATPIAPAETISRRFIVPVAQQGNTTIHPGDYTLRQFQRYTAESSAAVQENTADIHDTVAEITFSIVER